jgi:hypothetical protein
VFFDTLSEKERAENNDLSRRGCPSREEEENPWSFDSQSDP